MSVQYNNSRVDESQKQVCQLGLQPLMCRYHGNRSFRSYKMVQIEKTTVLSHSVFPI